MPTALQAVKNAEWLSAHLSKNDRRTRANCAKTLEPALATHATASIGRSMAKAARARPRLTGAAPRPACGLLATAANKRSRLPSALRISWFGSGAGRGCRGFCAWGLV